MNRIENLQFAVIGKFTYEWTDLEELRRIIPQQCKPVQLDLANINKTRPSCAKVKVLVDLKGEFPKVVLMDIENEVNGEIRTKVIQINYDYVPQYCEECKIQGHGMDNCRFLSSKNGEEKAKILSSGKVVGDPGVWNVVKDKNTGKKKVITTQAHPMVENSFEILSEESQKIIIQPADNNRNDNNNRNTMVNDKQEINNNNNNNNNNKQHGIISDKERLQAHTKLQVSELQFSRWKKGKMTHIDQTTPNLQKDRNMMNQVSTHKANKDIVPEPAPYTAKNDIHIDLVTPIITTKQVLSAGATTTHTNQQPNQEKASEI
ncbi:hypothetical protein H5410_047137 [Solanum commersonii]|uniref:DUF4283 domain-containing protein n=1 Tax=Solanum commersonii TaxID=4109 RepID=A0A9J5XGD4_SOLCO|nr:hypothetical protein H5410_047137 [Solanum commersonii]